MIAFSWLKCRTLSIKNHSDPLTGNGFIVVPNQPPHITATQTGNLSTVGVHGRCYAAIASN